jgi:hypothetical protein
MWLRAGRCATEAPYSHDGTDQRPREEANGVDLDDRRSQRLARVGRAGMGDESVGQHDGDQIGPLLDERTAALFLGCRSGGQGHLWLGMRHGVARYSARAGRCVVMGLCVTISIGLADWLEGPHHEKMPADAYLYAAKRAGRNRTRRAVDAGARDTQEGHAGYPSP